MEGTEEQSSVIGTVVMVVSVIVGSIGVGIYFLQNKLVYFPQVPLDARTFFLPAADFQLEDVLEEVFIKTSDGLTLQTYLFKHSKSTIVPTIIYFHGNAGNLSYRLPNVKNLFSSSHIQANVLLVSYRGYGKSDGSPCEKGLNIDADAVLKYVIENPDLNEESIFVFGRSLGGAVAASLAARNQDKIRGVIMENTFTSIDDMIDVVMPFFSYFKMLSRNKWNTKKLLENITTPILLISGMKDELVPTAMMQTLFDTAEHSTIKKLAFFKNGRHMDTYLQPNYYSCLGKFINTVLSSDGTTIAEVVEL
eukprot:CAMPEP_0174255278 /NCGR_PEP_ID=MMETSP0439-20130205/4628_1 /TAXON_ID=0 /ORGANISM="Stereomyxa ramosa, Strain Chinc5" /LENGTH=306 /DNA_ID=CAMNT_0015337395 /DNA_START=49 /DNA_END=969 /DNA_ORIENTATION=-